MMHVPILPLALTAAQHGAHIANYVEMTTSSRMKLGKVVGVQAVDKMTNDTFEIMADKVVLGGWTLYRFHAKYGTKWRE